MVVYALAVWALATAPFGGTSVHIRTWEAIALVVLSVVAAVMVRLLPRLLRSSSFKCVEGRLGFAQIPVINASLAWSLGASQNWIAVGGVASLVLVSIVLFGTTPDSPPSDVAASTE